MAAYPADILRTLKYILFTFADTHLAPADILLTLKDILLTPADPRLALADILLTPADILLTWPEREGHNGKGEASGEVLWQLHYYLSTRIRG